MNMYMKITTTQIHSDLILVIISQATCLLTEKKIIEKPAIDQSEMRFFVYLSFCVSSVCERRHD